MSRRPRKHARIHVEPTPLIPLGGQPRVLRYTRAEVWLAGALLLVFVVFAVASYQRRLQAGGRPPKPLVAPTPASSPAPPKS